MCLKAMFVNGDKCINIEKMSQESTRRQIYQSFDIKTPTTAISSKMP